MRRTNIVFHACNKYTWIEDWLSIVVPFFTHYKANLPPTLNIVFQNFLTHTICHLPTYPITPMFHGIVKNIQLHKKKLHGYIYYHGLTMTKQMKNDSKLNKFYLPINVNCTITDLLQHYCRTFDKIQLFISNINVFSPLAWLPKPCNGLHVSIESLIWALRAYLYP